MVLSEWQQDHRNVIHNFLSEMNKQSDSFILKGGTALMECYHLNRFSEDIDLDAARGDLSDFVDTFCRNNDYNYRVAKNTPVVKRFMIHYNPATNKPLKVEISFRNKSIPANTFHKVNGIQVYTIDRLAQLKSNAYQGRDKIRDLYDLCFICDNYFLELSDSTVTQIADALSYKGFENFDYLVETQKDDLIDQDKLAESYLRLFDKLELLYTSKEKEMISRIQLDSSTRNQDCPE